MEKYLHKRKCPKCGQKDIYDHFVEKGERIDDSFLDPFDTTNKDIIRRYCRNCSWKWSELPLDK